MQTECCLEMAHLIPFTKLMALSTFSPEFRADLHSLCAQRVSRSAAEQRRSRPGGNVDHEPARAARDTAASVPAAVARILRTGMHSAVKMDQNTALPEDGAKRSRGSFGLKVRRNYSNASPTIAQGSADRGRLFQDARC